MFSAFRIPRMARSATVACSVNWARCSAWSSTLEPRVLNNTETFNQGNSMPALPSSFIANTVSRLGLAIETNSTRPISKLSNSSASSFTAAMRGRNFALSSPAIIRGISRKARRGISLCAWNRHETLRYALRKIQIGFPPRIRIITLFAFRSTNVTIR